MPASNFGSGGIWNAIALSNRIENLSGTTLNNVTVSGIAGLAASEIPDLSGSYLSIASTTTARSTLGVSYASATDITNDVSIAAWGDSLTAGTGGSAYISTVGTLAGYGVYNGGVGGESSTQIKTRMLAATDKHRWPTIIWAGRNNYADSSTVVVDVASMVAALASTGNSDYLVLSVLNSSAEIAGTGAHTQITSLNAQLAAIYGTHYLDVRTFLVQSALSDAELTPTAQDISDIANDIVPTQLRSDAVHLNPAGYTEVARYVYQNIDRLRQLPASSVLRPIDIPKLLSSAVVRSTSTVTSFTGTERAALTVADDGVSNYSGIDFRLGSTGSTHPIARIAAKYSAQGSSLQFGTSNLWANGVTNTALTIDLNGKLGVGTTTPTAKFQVWDGSIDVRPFSSPWLSTEAIQLTHTAGNPSLRLFRTAGDGTNAYPWYIQAGGSAVGNLEFLTGSAAPIASESVSAKLVLTSTGRLGIATTTPWRTLSVGGTVGFDGLTGSTGSGSLCLTANKEVAYNSGSDNCLSSLRSTKHDISSLTIDALGQVLALQPVSFVYNNDASSTVRYGFIADDAIAVDSHLGTYNADGDLSGVDDRSIIAVVVKGIQTLAAKVSGLADSFMTKELTFDRASGKQLCLQKSDGTDVCVTGEQLAAALGGISSAGSLSQGEDTSDASLDTTPPDITTNGENPATIHVGDRYADLGAAVANTIDDVAVGSAGNTATSTRTVIVEAPSVSSEAPVVDSTDDASTLDASTTTEAATTTTQ